MSEPLVTALVSTWASERYLRGCLDDLLAQTLGERLEILVVDAASPEREGEIVRAYQRRHANVRYLRTPQRVNSSVAFALGTAAARGRYLTTANTDDRHRPDALAVLAKALETPPGFGIAYADSRITTRDNETWAAHSATARYCWPDFSLPAALSCCLFGAQPLWRKDAHAVAGDWDPALERCNDHDLFVRIAWRTGAVHVREELGLFLQRPDSVSGASNRAATLAEVMAVMKKYRAAIPLDDLFPALRRAGDSLARAAAWFELGNLCAQGPYTDAEMALHCWQQALRVPVGGGAAATVRAAFANNSGCVLAAGGADDAAQQALRLAGGTALARANQRTIAAARARSEPPRLRDLAFAEIDHPVVAASRAVRGLELGAGGELGWSAPHAHKPWQVFDGPSGVPVARVAVPASVPTASAGRPRVLLVQYGWADSGGGTILPRAFARELAGRGHEVAVFYAAARRDADLPAYGVRPSSEDGVRLYGLYNRPADFMDLQAPLREIEDPRVEAAFGAVLDEWAPDVVHFWNLHNLGLSLPGACRARGIPTVLSSNNYWVFCPRLYLIDERLQRCEGPSADGRRCESCVSARGSAAAHAARRRAAQRMLQGDVDVHLAVATRVRDLYVQNGDDPAHVRVLRQEPPQVAAIWERTGQKRRRVDSLRRPLRVGYVGSVMAHKGVHVLAQALQLLPAGAVECVALGDVAPDYAAVLSRLDPGRRLHCAGPYAPEQLAELLGALDVVVVPSVWDDCAPFVVAEALAARCPVVGSRIGGIPDFVRDGENGLLFAAGDAADLARCLRAFGDDPRLLGRLQAAITPPRGLPAFADDVLAVYEEVRRGAAVPAPLLP